MLITAMVKAIWYGVLCALITLLVAILMGLISWLSTILTSAITTASPISGLVLTAIASFLISVIMSVMTLRYAASATGYRALVEQPPFGRAFTGALIVTIVMIIVSAVLMVALFLVVDAAPEWILDPAMFEGWVTDAVATLSSVWDQSAIVMMSIAMGVNVANLLWLMIMIPVCCGSAKGLGYTTGLILGRFLLALPLFSALAVFVLLPGAAVLASVVLTGTEELSPAAPFIAIFGGLALVLLVMSGWVMAFEFLLLRGLVPISAADADVFGPAPNPAEIRAVRKSWESRG